MLPARPLARCPSSRIIGTANAHKYNPEFSKRSNNDSEKATLASSADAIKPGVIYEIRKADLKALDKAEGTGFGYDRIDDFDVKAEDAWESVTAETYISRQRAVDLIPFDWYLAIVVVCIDHHGLSETCLKKMHSEKYSNDHDHSRQSQNDTLAALATHGYRDHSILQI